MNLKQLEAFVWTVRLNSFSAAAKRLNSSQPAVSMRIQDLEQALGAELFEEPRRATRLTLKGRDLMEYAERILALSSEVQTRIGNAEAVSGRIRFGVGETIALTWLPDFIARLNETYPGLVVESVVDLTVGLWEKFDSGEMDLLLLPGPAYGANMVVNHLGTAEYSWLASPKLGIPANRTLMPKELETWPIVTLSQDSVLHEIIENWFLGNRAEPRRTDVCNSLGVVLALTVSGLGISLLPPSIYQREIDRGELMVIKTAPRFKPIEFISVYRKDRKAALIRDIARIASQASTFDAVPAPLATGPG